MTDPTYYDYHLPPELIAQFPLPERADARLMVVDRAEATWRHRHIRDLPELLRRGDALVLNDSRVIPARLVGHRTETGGRWEGLFLSADAEGNWRLLCKCRGKLAEGESITVREERGDPLRLALLKKQPDGVWLARPLAPGGPHELLERVGRVPLPPYIRGGEMTDSDRQRYQTVYAREPGSIAAPTAGLHFTDRLLGQLRDRGVEQHTLTLHVGLGTFRPIQADTLDEHQMHAEWAELDADTAAALNRRRADGGRIIAVGTTAIRVLESAADERGFRAYSDETRLFIRPGHRFHVDGLLTNFHLPRSTLLILVRAFGGDELIRTAYEEAIRERYRFYSYGDAMLLV